jgi:hypothetical protein
MASQYHQITDNGIQDRVRSKYRASIDQLKALNFQELCFFSETVWGLGLANGLLGPLGVLAASFKEVMRIGKDLSANLFFLLLASREYDTYVAPFGMGVKFYTSFTDGTCVITTNFLGENIHDDGEKLYKSAQPGPIEAAWKHHQAWVSDLTARGKQRNYHLSFDDFAKLACKEDNYMLKPKFINTALFGDIGSILIGAVIFGALFAALISVIVFWSSLAWTLYPACQSVRSLGSIPLLASLLVLFFAVPISWFLAQVQRTTVLYEGIGTMLYGRTLLPDSHGYISTKWLVIFHLPVVPVRSYEFVEEISKSSAQRLPVMRPLDQLHWEQVKETLWKFKWWYAVVAIAWIGWGVWIFSQCV